MATMLLVTRLRLGLGMAAHGAPKLFGWFGGRMRPSPLATAAEGSAVR